MKIFLEFNDHYRAKLVSQRDATIQALFFFKENLKERNDLSEKLSAVSGEIVRREAATNPDDRDQISELVIVRGKKELLDAKRAVAVQATAHLEKTLADKVLGLHYRIMDAAELTIAVVKREIPTVQVLEKMDRIFENRWRMGSVPAHIGAAEGIAFADTLLKNEKVWSWDTSELAAAR